VQKLTYTIAKNKYMGRKKLGWNKRQVQIHLMISAKEIIHEFGIDTEISDVKIEKLVKKLGSEKYQKLVNNEGDE
jgi:hypothetical protein